MSAICVKYTPLLNQDDDKVCMKWLAAHISYIHKLARHGTALTAGVQQTVTFFNCLLNSLVLCTRTSQMPSLVNNIVRCATACMPLWFCSNATNAIAVKRMMTSHERGVKCVRGVQGMCLRTSQERQATSLHVPQRCMPMTALTMLTVPHAIQSRLS